MRRDALATVGAGFRGAARQARKETKQIDYDQFFVLHSEHQL